MNSLRTRLIVGVVGLMTVIWLGVTFAAWLETRHETEEILDAHLAQAAALLTAFVGHEADELDEHLPTNRYLHKVTFQVWDGGRSLLVHSANAPDHRLSASDHGFSDASFDGKRWRVFSQWSGEGRYLVQVGETFDVRDDISRELAGHLLAPLLVALPLLALGLALLIGRGLRPLSTLADDISRRDAKRLDQVDTARAPNELKPVLDRLNQLFARLSRSIELERRFTADAAHELRTPLAAMRTHAQVAQGATMADERTTALANVIEATDRATRLVEQLLTLARLEAPAAGQAFVACDLREIAGTALATAAPSALAKEIDVELTAGPDVSVPGDPTLLEVLLRNLIDNAIRYSPQKVGVGVTVSVTAAGEPFVAVIDQGPGIPPAERSRVLDRFHRIAGNGSSGSGLGLSIAARIAELHDARLELDSGPGGKGLCARVVFSPRGSG